MNCSACTTSNPPWATECCECGAELAKGDWRPPSWLAMKSGEEPVIFALRRRRRRRQWYSLIVVLLVVGGIAYGRMVREWLRQGPTTQHTVLVPPVPSEDLTGGTTESFPSAAPTESGSESAALGLESGLPTEAVESGEAGAKPDGWIGRGEERIASALGRAGVRIPLGGGRVGGHRVGGHRASGGAGRHFQELVWPKDGATMVRVAGGSFPMGSSAGDDAEKPVHTVALRPFYIDRTEVTNAQYKKFVDATGHAVPCASEPWASPYNWDRGSRAYPAGKGDWPVVLVSWSDALAYARWAGKRLPTEAEWEYAARGAAGSIYPWGSGWASGRCSAGGAGLAPAGRFASGVSWCGALDMAGNAWEWCADWFDPTYYAKSPSANPAGPSVGRYRVLRGGCFASTPELCRSTTRLFRPPQARSEGAGFRCVADG